MGLAKLSLHNPSHLVLLNSFFSQIFVIVPRGGCVKVGADTKTSKMVSSFLTSPLAKVEFQAGTEVEQLSAKTLRVRLLSRELVLELLLCLSCMLLYYEALWTNRRVNQLADSTLSFSCKILYVARFQSL